MKWHDWSWSLVAVLRNWEMGCEPQTRYLKHRNDSKDLKIGCISACWSQDDLSIAATWLGHLKQVRQCLWEERVFMDTSSTLFLGFNVLAKVAWLKAVKTPPQSYWLFFSPGNTNWSGIVSFVYCISPAKLHLTTVHSNIVKSICSLVWAWEMDLIKPKRNDRNDCRNVSNILSFLWGLIKSVCYEKNRTFSGCN